jgi:hypothetical protein
MPRMDKGRLEASQVEKENGKWLGYEGDAVCVTKEVSLETVE